MPNALVPIAPPTILAVDDDPTTRAIFTVLFRKHGLSAVTCANGAEMWAALERFTPTLIILDVQMPGDDGFSLAEKLRSRYGLGIIIIMLTSRSGGMDLAVGMDIGADDYLVKPCDWKILLSHVRRHLSASTFTTAGEVR